MRILIGALFLLFSCNPVIKPYTPLTDKQWIDSMRISNLKLDSISAIESQINCSYWNENPCIDTSMTEVYRFNWNRSFDAPISITISNYTNKIFKLYAKKPDVTAKDSILIIDKELTQEDWNFFKKHLDESLFWRIGQFDGHPYDVGTDGSTWVLKGYRKNPKRLQRKFHTVLVNNPRGGSFWIACMKLIEISKLAEGERIY